MGSIHPKSNEFFDTSRARVSVAGLFLPLLFENLVLTTLICAQLAIRHLWVLLATGNASLVLPGRAYASGTSRRCHEQDADPEQRPERFNHLLSPVCTENPIRVY